MATSQCRYCNSTDGLLDLMKEYSIQGITECYSNILVECFNIFISTNPSMSHLICSMCIRCLQEANNFRKLVLQVETKLIQSLNDVFVNVPNSSEKRDIEISVKDEVLDVKQEICEGDCDEVMEYECGGDGNTVEETDIFIKADPNANLTTNSKLQALLSRYKSGTLSQLPTRATLYSNTQCAGFVNILDSLQGKIITGASIAEQLENQEKIPARTKTKGVFVTEKWAYIINASTILSYSNAMPFKSKNVRGFPCFYCTTYFQNREEMKKHQSLQHINKSLTKILSTHGPESFIVYVDVTDLKCTICNTNMANINELKLHLIKIHNKKMYQEHADRVIPFKISEKLYECQVCEANFEAFGAIERHMNVHYRNYVCNDCGAGFVTKYRLKIHSKSHEDGEWPCEICKKVYTSQQKKSNHINAVHKMVKRFKCPKCPERFTEYFRRHKHMTEAHNMEPLVYACTVCEKTFHRKYTLSRHLKRDHLEERDHKCGVCSYSCFSANELRIHMIKHNGERIHECEVCKKSYARKKTLREHMRIHNNDRRFVCPCCGQAFVQKCSLKGHMKTHHVDYSLPV